MAADRRAPASDLCGLGARFGRGERGNGRGRGGIFIALAAWRVWQGVAEIDGEARSLVRRNHRARKKVGDMGVTHPVDAAMRVPLAEREGQSVTAWAPAGPRGCARGGEEIGLGPKGREGDSGWRPF